MGRIRGKQIDIQTITNENIYIGLPPINPTDAISLEYLDIVLSGLTLSGSSMVGDPRNGDWATEGGYFQGVWENTTPTGFAFDDLSIVIGKLLPTPPPNLSTKTLLYGSLYTAREQSSGTIYSNITTTKNPTSTIASLGAYFYSSFSDGSTGTLSATIDGIPSGSTVLYTGFTGTDQSLTVLTNSDPYSGQTGKAGFYYSVSASITPTFNFTPSNTLHSYGLSHTTTGTANSGTGFHVDNPITATITNPPTVTLPGSTSRYISGVKSLSFGQTVSVDYIVNSAVSYYYHQTRIGEITSTLISTSPVNSSQPSPIPNIGETVTFTGQIITIGNNKFGPQFTFGIRGYNSYGTAGTLYTVSTNTYIDTVSDETIRKFSGSGQFPITGYGSIYPSGQTLESNEELQMINGIFQYPPSIDYSTYSSPTVGPNYIGLSGTRWATFNLLTLSSNKNIQITFNGTSGTWGSNPEVSGIEIYAKVEGVTGWVDVNKSFTPSIPNPSVDGDPAMVNDGSSTNISKKLTFGSTVRSGVLYLRVGLPSGSDKKWQTVSATILV